MSTNPFEYRMRGMAHDVGAVDVQGRLHAARDFGIGHLLGLQGPLTLLAAVVHQPADSQNQKQEQTDQPEARGGHAAHEGISR